VGPNTETCCSHNLPGLLAVSVKTLSLDGARLLPVRSVMVNFFQSRPMPSTLAETTVAPLDLASDAVSGPISPSVLA
jgi:hypothetical protein